MENNFDKISIIGREKLNSEFYFQSLLENAHAKGLLTDNNIERIQYECVDLLAYKTEHYNSGDSSSIKVEKAQDIMISNLFTIGLWLKTYQSPNDAILALQNESIKDIYKKGRIYIDDILLNTKSIHSKLLHQLIDSENIFYCETLKDGINGFFKLYYPDYTAHEIHITADYLLYNPTPKLAGIEFIQSYVEGAYYENLFCSYFASDDIHHLLCGYAKNYQELLINIYEFVLTAAIGCILVEEDIHRLYISKDKVTYLINMFLKMSKEEIPIAIQKATYKLSHILQFPDKLNQYIQRSLSLIIDKIKTALQEQMLEHIFYTPDFPEYSPKIIFSLGSKMNDEKYREIVSEIIGCRFSQDKMKIIKEQVNSLADLEDILLDAALTKKEMQTIFSKLSLSEIAAFSNKFLLESDIDITELQEQEEFLRNCLYNFISQLPQNQQITIKKIGNLIEDE